MSIDAKLNERMSIPNLNTLFFGKNLLEPEEIDSTNGFAMELLHTGKPPEGTCILTWYQYSGRGQRGTSWISEPGKNITASIILFPGFLLPTEQFLLNKAISLGVYDYAKSMLGKNVAVKWPNDIIYKGKKLAGILIENTIRSTSLASSVIGIGFNINQTKFATEANNPTSLKKNLRKEFIVRECFADLLSFLESRYLQLKSGKSKQLHSEYLNALYLLGKWRYFETQAGRIRLKITGVNAEGKLETENKSGNKVYFNFKEIIFPV